ncbi:ribonuclease kappa-B-like [Centruroides sculpturatus]|uniref:ribonuclease kappa-B-like n=1 Tax=Centruroides sculpturatus TaxID=218467 RepID=UPI000C6D7A92|nr:ribonuclease kappa-B-like [Centruroides sculpturatus]
MALFRICGPKLSVCCSVLSIWGIIMLVLMGIFLYCKSVAFVEDLAIDERNHTTRNELLLNADNLYKQAAYNCWVAACLYIISLAVSVHQYFMNRQASYSI